MGGALALKRCGQVDLVVAGVLLPVLVFLSGTQCWAQRKKTDAQTDWLSGPVRSVTTKQTLQKVDLPSYANEVWLPILLCGYCEYDREGNRLRFGQLNEGLFQGQVVRLVRGTNGRVSEKFSENAQGEVFDHEVWGPFGITEHTQYFEGKVLSHSTSSYDETGRVSEYHFYDKDGIQQQSTFVVNGPVEHNREEWDYGKDGAFHLHFIETYDPKTDFWTLTNLNEDGSVKVAVETLGTGVVSYRQNTDEANAFGSGFFMDPTDKKLISYRCHSDSSCDQSTAFCTDETCRMVSRHEWRDSHGTLRLFIEIEYELDEFGNWTKRTTWMSSPEWNERKLVETEYRTLQYWPN